MLIKRSYKVALRLNNSEKGLFSQCAGTARWAFNWGLNQKIEAHQNGEKVPNAIELHKKLNQGKKDELSWMYEQRR